MQIKNKILSILCATAMLVGMGAIAAPIPTVSATTTYTHGFEPTLGYHYGSSIELSSEQAYEGNYSVKTTIPQYTSSAINNRVVIQDDNGPVAFDVTTTYEVTMQIYAVTEFVAKVRVTSEPTLDPISTHSYDGRANEAGNVTLAAGEWTQVTVTATPKSNIADATTAYLSVAVITHDDSNAFTGYPYVVYVDNVSVKVAGAEEELLLQTFEDSLPQSHVYGQTTVSTEQYHSGGNALKLTIDNAETSGTTDRALLRASTGLLSYTVGNKYEVSLWVYTDDSFTSKVRLSKEPGLQNMNGVHIDNRAYDMTESVLPTGEWTKITYTVNAMTATANGETTGYLAIGVAATSKPESPVTVYIDDITITETPAKELVTYESVLNGKSALFTGDSIAAGWRDTAYGKETGTNGGGWATRLQKHWLMNTAHPAFAGASLTEIANREHIIDQLEANENANFDYVIMEGGFNDCMGTNVNPAPIDGVAKLGAMSTSYDVKDFDTSTFAGAFEELLYCATTYFPGAKIGFIITYDTPLSTYGGITNGTAVSNEGYTLDDYYNLQMEICEKWNVPYLNLYSGTAPDGKKYSGEIINVNDPDDHFYGGSDQIHLNTAGYDVITPYIAQWMEGLPSYEAPAVNTTITVDNAEAKGGDTVTLEVTLSNNAGMNMMTLTPQVSEGLTITNVTNGSLFDSFTKGKNYVWDHDENVTDNGVLCTLTVQVAEDATVGAHSVGFIVRECYTETYDDVPVDVKPGTVTVASTPVEATMNPIRTIYQYVGGGVDNTTLGGADNSAVYTHEGQLKTAFRVPGKYETDSADFSTIRLNGKSYPIEERGIILGREGQELTVDSPSKVSSTDFKNKYWNYDATTKTVTYTALVKHVTEAKKDVKYIARSYVKINVNGATQIVYSDVSAAFSSQQLYDATAEAYRKDGKNPPKWFVNDKIDDGVIEFE